LAVTTAVGIVSALSYLGLRQGLDREVNASLLNVAAIQAAAVTDDPQGAMRFPEWELTPEEAVSVRDLIRYSQIWSGDGQSLVRGRQLNEDLPLDRKALDRAVADELVWTHGDYQGIRIRSLYYPLERLGSLHTRHVLQVAAPLDARDRMLARVGLLLFGVVSTIAVATFLGAGWLAEKVVRPVDAIIDQAEGIARGDTHRRIEAFADTTEYQRLVQVLNRMLERLEAALETQKRFAADASHELRTPLTALRGELEVALRRDRSSEEYTRVLGSALEEAERLSRLADDLLTLTRSEAGVLDPHLQEVDLRERIERTAGKLSGSDPTGSQQGFVVDGDPGDVWVDPGLFDQVLWNLLHNAAKYSPAKDPVRVGLIRTETEVIIEVRDQGAGIPVEDLDRIFERFFRADASRAHAPGDPGTGLGLAITKAIVELHRGTITAENHPDRGAVFTVRIPAEEPSARVD
jgi:two-component system OmpR family sensor kinase